MTMPSPNPSDWEKLIPMLSVLGGALVGGSFSFLGAIVGQWLTSKRERRNKRAEVQLNVIYEIQDEMQVAMSVAMDKYLARSGSTKPRKDVGSFRSTYIRLNILKARLEDREAKKLLESFLRNISLVKDAETSTDYEVRKKAMTVSFLRVNKKIGQIINYLH
jgi:hypothetical protein